MSERADAMTTGKHSPAPWDSESFRGAFTITDARGYVLAQRAPWPEMEEESEANGRIMAAAPELLAAAANLVASWDADRGPEKRGEFEGVGYWSPAGRMVATEFIVALRAAISKAEGSKP